MVGRTGKTGGGGERRLKWEGFDAWVKEVFFVHSFRLDVCFGGCRVGENGFSLLLLWSI